MVARSTQLQKRTTLQRLNLYTGTSDGNKLLLAGEKSASAVTLANDSAKFYVRLSSPAEKDVTVTLAATSDGVEANSSEEVMSTDANQPLARHL